MAAFLLGSDDQAGEVVGEPKLLGKEFNLMQYQPGVLLSWVWPGTLQDNETGVWSAICNHQEGRRDRDLRIKGRSSQLEKLPAGFSRTSCV